MPDYIPSADGALDAWQDNFVTYATANTAALGLDPLVDNPPLATDTRTPYVADFNGADANKVAHYMLRWESTLGDVGSWSETASATIGA